jgi:hypothetical protein
MGELNYGFDPTGQSQIGKGGMQPKVCVLLLYDLLQGKDQGKGKRKEEETEAGSLSWGSKKARKAKKDTASHDTCALRQSSCYDRPLRQSRCQENILYLSIKKKNGYLVGVTAHLEGVGKRHGPRLIHAALCIALAMLIVSVSSCDTAHRLFACTLARFGSQPLQCFVHEYVSSRPIFSFGTLRRGLSCSPLGRQFIVNGFHQLGPFCSVQCGQLCHGKVCNGWGTPWTIMHASYNSSFMQLRAENQWEKKHFFFESNLSNIYVNHNG